MKQGLHSLGAAALALAALAGPAIAKDKNAEAAPPPSGSVYSDLTGAWTGTVEEIDVDPYRIDLRFDSRGQGRVHYSGYDCSGLLNPIAPLDGSNFGETIMKGRDVCADGTVQLTRRNGHIEWIWINADGQVQATAILRRSD